MLPRHSSALRFPYTTLFRSVLHRIAARPAHGYDLLQEIETKTEGVWRPGAGSIYPILKELVRGGYIRAESQKKTGKPQHVDRKSTRLNSSHRCISYAVFCLK